MTDTSEVQLAKLEAEHKKRMEALKEVEAQLAAIRAANRDAKLIEINDCTTYIEPFCGGAAIPLELLFHNNIKRVILNDYDYSIYCFWESVLTDTDAFSKKIFDTPITVNEWKKQKQIRSTFSQHTPLEIGFSTFFLNTFPQAQDPL